MSDKNPPYEMQTVIKRLKVKVFPYSLLNVGLGVDPGVQVTP